jgi:ABC-type nickel/cobalt efflux system permease component RcnA
MARIAALQTAFNRDLTEALKALKAGGAFWWLGGISFLYGIVHAAGPGHGKVVISSYLVANEAGVRRGVAIAFLAALAQAVVAVAIIGLLAVILNMTSMAIDSTARLFEAGSFALVAALGLYLLLRKGRDAWSLFTGGDSHAHHHHAPLPSPATPTSPDSLDDRTKSPDVMRGAAAPASVGAASVDRAPLPGHHHSTACSDHRRAVAADIRPGLAGAAAAVLSVGIRPCSGALVVLVFALAQGIFWAGIASTFLMALGTALTVACLAALAVGAKDLARRLAQGGEARRAAQAILALELLAALFVAILGAVLFVGALQT